MTFPYKSKGVGLDLIFEAYTSGPKAAPTGYKVNGIDLKDLFAPLSAGSAAAVTFYKVNGADLNTIFAKKGSVSSALPIDGQTFHADSSGNVSSSMTARITLAINAAGTYNVTCLANNIETAPANGTWLPAGAAASDYQVQFVIATNSTRTNGGAVITNGAAAYSACTANRTAEGEAISGQLTAQDKGGNYTVTINLKKISTGVVTSTVITWDIESVGTG